MVGADSALDSHLYSLTDSTYTMAMLSSEKPVVLLLGQIFFAFAEWDALAAVAELRVRPENLRIGSSAAAHGVPPTPFHKPKADRCFDTQQIHDGDRDRFLSDCKSGVHDGVFAISRTYDSVQVCQPIPLLKIAAIATLGKPLTQAFRHCAAHWAV